MVFGLIGSDVVYYEDICELTVLGDLFLMYEETCVSSLDISDSLEKASYLICKSPCLFCLVIPLH